MTLTPLDGSFIAANPKPIFKAIYCPASTKTCITTCNINPRATPTSSSFTSIIMASTDTNGTTGAGGNKGTINNVVNNVSIMRTRAGTVRAPITGTIK